MINMKVNLSVLGVYIVLVFLIDITLSTLITNIVFQFVLLADML